jgi:hypothetical protein
VFGTELFTPITFITINDYIENKIRNAKRFIKADIAFWDHLYEGLLEQFNAIRIRYKLAFCYEPDYIRLFTLLYTARYSSFFTAAFNQSGYQLEPYATYSILDLALRIAPKLWGNPRRLAGDYRIQKAALARLNPKMAKEMTFSSLRPMVPLSVASLPYYMFGATLQAGYWLKERASKHTNRTSKVLLSSGFLMTDGWEKEFIRRTEENYGPIVNVLT